MPLEFTFGGTCRNVDLLPKEDAELRSFFDNQLVPAMWENFSQSVAVIRADVIDNDRVVNIGLSERGCDVTGGVKWTW